MDEGMLNDLLECSVCLERLDTSSKVLPCQHTFCKKCLEEIVYTHKELRCPECRVLVDVGIDELPPNVLLMRILEGMKNAPKRTSAIAETVNVANHSKSSTMSVFSMNSRVRSRSSNRSEPHYAQCPQQPYAVAKCDYVPKEPGDLSFRRGDVILLRRRIEHRWYQGECNGVLGVFPLSYVQVIVPLSSHVPQCKALYDFGKCHEDDDGCLHFSKGDVIHVIRRIDENWAEGKLDDRIGIFPISFVEMNNLAKNLMKSSLNSSSASSRDAPPTPTDESAPLLSNEGPSFVNTSPSQILSDGLALFSPSSSSSTTSTATTSPTSSESTTPSSPSTSPSAVPHTQIAPIKRHSYTPGAQPPPYHAPPSVHRHSAEIVKAEESTAESMATEQRGSYLKDSKPRHQRSPPKFLHHIAMTPASSLEETPVRQTYHRKKTQSELPATEANREPQSLGFSTKQTNGNLMFQRQSSLRLTKSALVHSKLVEPPVLPSMYIAIYPYKPQKTDELELKIGSVYTVIERCQDGWFKGTSHPNPQCGVFPGNYVTPVKSLPMLQAQLKGLVHNSSVSPRHETRTSSDTRLISSVTKSSSNSVLSSSIASTNCVTTRLAPPEIPARASSPILGSNTSQKISSTTWHVPTCGVLEKSSWSPTAATKGRSKNVSVESNGTSPKANESKTLKSAERSKDKREKVSVSLMRRLTSMKKSRSPPPTSTYSIDNPVFEDSGSATHAPIAHARSDSCPSQLLSFSSQTHATSSSSNHHVGLVGGSQRVKHKPRASLQYHSTRAFDGNISMFSSPGSTKPSKEDKPVISHRKSSSLDTTVYDERETQNGKSKPADPPPRERYRCITPYPPNSEFELELRVGDVIYVHKKRDDGWYRGTLQRNGRTGLFPVSFVERLH